MTALLLAQQNDEYLFALRLDIEMEIKEKEIIDEKIEVLRGDIEKKIIEFESSEDDVIESQKYHYSPKSLRDKRLLFFEKSVITDLSIKSSNNEQPGSPKQILSDSITVELSKVTCNCLTKKGTLCKLIAKHNGKCHIHSRTNN